MFFEFIWLRRIGLRRAQREQIEANSSFFRAIAEFFNVKSKGEKEKLGLNIPLASGQETTEPVVLFENPENSLDLDGSVPSQKNALVARESL